MTPEDALLAAARAIGQMPEADLQRKFAQLHAERKARPQWEALRQQAESDSLELDEAAYHAAIKDEEDGDLIMAARWYRAAAVNDFPGASLKLATVLAALVAEHHARGETRAEVALIEEALEWCTRAYAAGEFVEGEIEASDLMEELLDGSRLGR